MALTKETIIDKLEVVGPFKKIGIREAVVVSEDGVELARSFKRRILHSDEDISSEGDEVKSVTSAGWTDAVKAAWISHKEANKE